MIMSFTFTYVRVFLPAALVREIAGYRHQGFYGKAYTPAERIGMDGILHRVSIVVKGEKEVMKDRFRCVSAFSIVDRSAWWFTEEEVFRRSWKQN